MFDLSIWKLLALALIALVIFGPDKLPGLAKDAGRTLRQLRRMSTDARSQLREGLGGELADLDLAELHPRTFVRRALLDDDPPADVGAVQGGSGHPRADRRPLAAGEPAPFDPDAT